MTKKIALLPGDGIGPEVTREAVKVLKRIAKVFGHRFIFKQGIIGGTAIEKTGNPYPQETHYLCLNSDAVLFGAVGDPKYDKPKVKIRPEQGLLEMRKTLGLYANIRPIFVYPFLAASSPLKPKVLEGVDFVIIRELIGGIYFGKKERKKDRAFDVCQYSKKEISRVAEVAFDLALKRRKKITLVDKANVLETSRLWRETVQELSARYPSVKLNFQYVDNASMQIVKSPNQFDVILTGNLFGDIISDEASVIVGSLGMLPSASLGKRVALYEPIHGSYPQAAGKNIANPVAAILSAAMMLEFSFGLNKEAEAIREAVRITLKQGVGTPDIVDSRPQSTSAVGDKVADHIGVF